MTYVASNLYGRLDKYEKLIKKINLKSARENTRLWKKAWTVSVLPWAEML